MRKVYFYVTPEFNNHKLSAFLKHNGISERFISSLKQIKNSVTVNGKNVFMNYIIHEKDRVAVYADSGRNENICGVDLPVDIIYEDEDIAVINKEKGRPTHPSHRHRYDTLANALVFHWQKKGDGDAAFHPVHRLDMDTQGLILVAKNRLSAAVLSEAIKTDKGNAIRRKYIAVVLGRVDGDGIIEKNIKRSENTIIKREVCGEQEGEYAKTQYRVIKSNDELSLIELELFTGRTHQIRVHMSSIGHPLLCDNMYGGRSDGYDLRGQALVSSYLEFTHPITKERMKFELELPCDIKKIADEI